ncbi:hypothetical protein [Aquimarina spongiae]|uniref:Uncharacterized protein n=1 Tax=Aquimarina spongiae TaxID=570521 RepID=A0A1M6KV17_9FLAO|nr:hypothetical protein [Aquimarina spongiae]SHJ62702.1 hypothetical protein SAMN04488508_11277 [Aquimarina spongiae]
MSASKYLTRIKANINTWNEIRNTSIALNFLTSGYGFTVSFEDYQNWSTNNPTTLNCYFGVDEFELKFYIVDNVTDQNQSYQIGINLLEKEFTRSFNTTATKTNTAFKRVALSCNDQISKSEAEQRILNWMLGAKNWFKDQQQAIKSGSSGLLRLMTIPFEDLSTLFGSSQENVFVLTALNNFDIFGYNLEFILTREIELNEGETQKSGDNELFMDVSQPHPPFSLSSDFNLL